MHLSLPCRGRVSSPLALAAALALAACEGGGPAAAPSSQAGKDAQPRPVRLVAAEELVTDRRVSATGTLAADEQVVVGTKAAGRVAEMLVDLGSHVRRGQVVARLDPIDAKLRVDQAVAALQQARARLGLSPDGTDDRVDVENSALVRQARAVLAEAQQTRERTERLWKQGLIAAAQVDTAVATLAVAEGRYQDAFEEVRIRQGVLLQRRSELALARQQLADHVVVAPIDGAVSERRASAGEYLSAGAALVNLVKLHPLRLRLAVPEREAAGVRAGQSVLVTVEGATGVHRGRVVRIAPAISEQNRTLLVEAEVPNEAAPLRPGAFAKADIVVAGDVRVVTLPAAAVITFAGVEKVLRVEKGRTEEVRVQTGRQYGDRVEIVSGVAAGAQVVDSPGNLTAGQPVTVQR
jgi:RND family efflux transporter MFP subunit